MDLSSWYCLSNSCGNDGPRCRRRTALRVLHRSFCGAYRGLGGAAQTEVLRDFEPGSHGGVDAVFPHRASPLARLFNVEGRSVLTYASAEWRNAPRGHNLVSAWSVAGCILAPLVRRHHPSHSHASANSHPRRNGEEVMRSTGQTKQEKELFSPDSGIALSDRLLNCAIYFP